MKKHIVAHLTSVFIHHLQFIIVKLDFFASVKAVEFILYCSFHSYYFFL